MLNHRIGVRKIALTNGLSFFEVVSAYEQLTPEGELIQCEVILDSHWGEQTARMCCKRWALFYECNITATPLAGGWREVIEL